MPETNQQTKPLRAKASTADILGGVKNSFIINPKWKDEYQRLLDLRDQFRDHRGALVETAKQEQPVFSLHMADAGTDQYDQDFALSMISSEQSALYEIEEALNRIRNGTYGVCEITGKPIEPDRLEAIPWTRFSLEAQRELEDSGAVVRTKLADRATVAAATTADEDEDSDEAE